MDATGAIRQKRWRTTMRDDGFSRASFFVSPIVKQRIKDIAVRHGVTLSAAMEIAVLGYDDTAPASIESAPVAIDDAAVAIDDAPAVLDDFALGADTEPAPTELERKVLDAIKVNVGLSNVQLGKIVNCSEGTVRKVKKKFNL